MAPPRAGVPAREAPLPHPRVGGSHTRSTAVGAHPEGPRRHPHHPDVHGCGHCCTVACNRAGGGGDPRHRTCGRHSPPPLRPPQAAAHPLPLPPPPTRPYVIPASLPSSTWNALRQRWISLDSGATEWKASHVPVATGKWLARVGVAPPFFVRQRRSLATKVLMRLTWVFSDLNHVHLCVY